MSLGHPLLTGLLVFFYLCEDDLPDLLTAASIAATLGLPESTCRYYLRKYAAWVPTIGAGRNRRYGREAVDVLRVVAEMHQGGATADMVEGALRGQFPLNAEPQQQSITTQQQTATTPTEFRALLAEAMGEIIQEHTAPLVEHISALRAQVEELNRRLAEPQQQQPTTTADTSALEAEVKELRRALLDQVRQAQEPERQARPRHLFNLWRFWERDE